MPHTTTLLSVPKVASQRATLWMQRLRLATGLILFTYLSTHLLNHALGLVSLEVMETGRQWFLYVWRNPIGTVALYGALGIHFLLALWSLYRRPRLRMSLGEALQVLMGLSIPLLLATHVVGTRLAHAWYGVNDTYTYVVLALWQYRPDIGIQQSVVLLLGWTHGYEDTTCLTAVGDTVHVASRLEALNKEYEGPLIISEQVAQRAGIDVSDYSAHSLTVRNRIEPLTIRVIDAVPQIAAQVRSLLRL